MCGWWVAGVRIFPPAREPCRWPHPASSLAAIISHICTRIRCNVRWSVRWNSRFVASLYSHCLVMIYIVMAYIPMTCISPLQQRRRCCQSWVYSFDLYIHGRGLFFFSSIRWRIRLNIRWNIRWNIRLNIRWSIRCNIRWDVR